MTQNAEERLTEAKEETWLGGVSALEEACATCGYVATRPNDGSPTPQYWLRRSPPMEH